MKFCKNLQKVADISDPEWAPYWTNYKMLKKLIKELPSIVHEDTEANGSGEALSAGDHVTPPGGEPSAAALLSSESSSKKHIMSDSLKDSNDISEQQQQEQQEESTSSIPTEQPAMEPQEQLVQQDSSAVNCDDSSEGDRTALTTTAQQQQDFRSNPGEIAFFKMLRSEFGKATRFFDMAQREYTIREERVREGMDIVKKPNSIMVNEKWSALAKSIYRLYKDLLLLETYAIMTYCSFSKILKKHDKVTGCVTRVAFMSHVVAKANFTNYPEVLEMIRRCEKMYDEVSDHLVREGKTGLLEDERLFLNMISRLNAQALETPDAPNQQEGSARRSPVSAASIAAVPGKPESFEMARLRSIVESNDAASVSEGQEDERAGSKRKRAIAKEASKRPR